MARIPFYLQVPLRSRRPRTVTETTSITLLGLPLKERERLFPEVLGPKSGFFCPMDFGVFVSGLID